MVRRPAPGKSPGGGIPPVPYRGRTPWGPVAQLVEHLTFNQVVAGSIPAGLTIIF